MKAPADKSPDVQRQTTAHAAPQQQDRSDAESQFIDNRAETVSLRQLQEAADNSPRTQGLFQLNAMINRSPRSGAVRSLQAMVDNNSRRASMVSQVESDDLSVQRVEDKKLLQGKFSADSPTQLAQPSEAKPNNTGLPDKLKAGVESLSGLSLDNVKVHYNSSRPAQLNAHAYAQGTNIHVGPGQEQHLPHEAWHVVQQAQGRVKPTMQMKDVVNVNDDVSLEHEADIMGAKALQMKSGRVKGKTLNTSSVTGVIQRRIGFEIETGIPITEKIDNPDLVTVGAHPHIYEPTDPQDIGQTIKYGTLLISADGYGAHTTSVSEPFTQWPIVEGVTDPIDDSLTVNAFDAIARVWLNRLITIKTLAQTAPPARQLNGSTYYVGTPSAQAYGNWDRIAPQVTAGVPLDQVGKVISQFPLSGTTSAFNATQLAQAAPAKALAVIQKLLVVVNPNQDQEGVQEVKGLITLMMNYLTAGNDDDIAKVVYMKNRPANIFYKSKLSDVRTNLLNLSYGNIVFGNANNRIALRTLLLAESGRTAGDPLFKADPSPVNPQGVASNVTVGTWLTEVLDGTDDRIFDEMKNPWSDEIDPDANDEVVIELRKRAFNLTHSNFALEDFNSGLLEYMKKMYLANKAIKNHTD